MYILASRTRTLYTGVTNNLLLRVIQHKRREVPGFTQRYNVTRLVYFEQYVGIGLTLAREKQIRGLLRAKNIALIESKNPEWKDLSEGYISDYALQTKH